MHFCALPELAVGKDTSTTFYFARPLPRQCQCQCQWQWQWQWQWHSESRFFVFRVPIRLEIEDGRIRIKPNKTQKSSGKTVDIMLTPEISEVIARARAIKGKYGIISPFLFRTQKGSTYAKSSLYSMWDRAKERIGTKDEVAFKDIRALAATDAARRGEDRGDIQKRRVHSSSKTTDIYIKEVIPDVSEIPMSLKWQK